MESEYPCHSYTSGYLRKLDSQKLYLPVPVLVNHVAAKDDQAAKIGTND